MAGVVALSSSGIGYGERAKGQWPRLRGSSLGLLVLLRHGDHAVHAVAWRGERAGRDLEGEHDGYPQRDVAVDGAGGPVSKGSN